MWSKASTESLLSHFPFHAWTAAALGKKTSCMAELQEQQTGAGFPGITRSNELLFLYIISSPRANFSSRDSFQAMRRPPATGRLPIRRTALMTMLRQAGASPPGQD